VSKDGERTRREPQDDAMGRSIRARKDGTGSYLLGRADEEPAKDGRRLAKSAGAGPE
jgi:hypothetical protein